LCLLQVDRSILMVQGWVMSLLIRFFGYPDSSSLIHLGHQLNMGSWSLPAIGHSAELSYSTAVFGG
jgi:hypothetical protein